MSEYTDRLVQQTEAMLHFRHDETLTETSPERLHEALSDVIMMEINDRWSRTRHTQQNGPPRLLFLGGVSDRPSDLQQPLQPRYSERHQGIVRGQGR